jgi:hypothetical protein
LHVKKKKNKQKIRIVCHLLEGFVRIACHLLEGSAWFAFQVIKKPVRIVCHVISRLHPNCVPKQKSDVGWQPNCVHVFFVAHSNCTRTSLNRRPFTPRIIYADFEQAIHLAISEIFPKVIRKGCRFHLGQTKWRKIQSLGLRKNLRLLRFLTIFYLNKNN